MNKINLSWEMGIYHLRAVSIICLYIGKELTPAVWMVKLIVVICDHETLFINWMDEGNPFSRPSQTSFILSVSNQSKIMPRSVKNL